ncbi:nose resistant to fluoxetine protein 6-like isoform X2 [Atheta coriaria]|uniref:nose resistant to fluoxetine protein 6-like isoform X2 n=1 Tax=Dalotia coriaria TaxID=877792 RepID=UPI0031F35358
MFLVLDSIAKPSSGILEGNLINFGDFDECLSIQYIINTNKTQENENLSAEYKIQGKYCIASLNFTKSTYNLTIPSSFLPSIWKNNSKDYLLNGIHKYSALGICIPSSCNHENMLNLLNFMENLDYFITIDFKDNLCTTNDTKPLEIRHKIGLVFFTIILQIIIMSTLYDYFYIQLSQDIAQNKKFVNLSPISEALSSFSLYKNSKKLFSMNNSASNQINCLQGIKTLSIFWIILGHTFLFETISSTNILNVIKWSLQLQSSFVQAAYYAVDTFLVISGVLSGYLFCNSNSIRSFLWKQVPKMYLHRFVRLGPGLYAILILYITLGDRIGFGPYKLLLNSFETPKCLDKFTSEVFFIQNYHHPRTDCLGTMHSWYLAIEMQLCILLPIFIGLLQLRTSFFRFGVISMVAISIFTTFGAIYFNEIPITLEELGTMNKFGDYHQYYYYPLHTRMGSWFIGLFMGQWMTQKSFEHIELKRREIWIIWCLWMIIVSILFITQGHMKSDSWGFGTVAIYQSLSRPVFALCISWLIFACSKEYSGVINTVLTFKLYNFFSKIVFCMYLVHQPIMLFYTGEKRTPLYFLNSSGIFEFAGYLIFSIFGAVIWTLCFEMPVIQLEKCFLKHRYNNYNNTDLIQLK